MRLWVLGLLIVLACGIVGAASAVVYVDDNNPGDQTTDRTLADAGFDFNSSGRLTIKEDFTYQMSDNLKLTLMKGGKLTVKVENGKFQEATLDLRVQVEISIKGSTLKLKGSVTGKIDADYEIDFTGKLTVEEDFTYLVSDPVKVTLMKGGMLKVEVEQSKFKEATLDLTAQVEIAIEGQSLKLKGVISGKINEAYQVDFTGELDLMEDFVYQEGKVKVTLKKNGTAGIKIKQSKFEWATLNMTILSDFEIKGQWLKLKGTINGKINAAYEVDFTGSLTVEEDFSYSPSDSVKVTLVKGGELTATVEASKFQEATLDLTILAEITIEGSPLKLKGTVSGKIDSSFEVDFTGELTVMDDFAYQPSDRVNLTLMKGGKLGVKVEQSEFKWATIENLKVDVSIEIGDKDLKLRGSISEGKYDSDFQIDFNGELRLMEAFSYQVNDNVRLTLVKGGKLDVKVEQSKFQEATIDLKADVEVQIKDQSLKLNGKVSGKINGAYEADFTGRLKLMEAFTYQVGDSLKVTLMEGGKLTVKVEQSEFKWATLNLTVQVDVQIKDQILKLNGKVSGKINGAYEVDFTGTLRIEEDFTYQASDSIKVTLMKGGKVSVRVEKSEFKEATLDLRVLAEVQINGSTLKLKGPVTGKIDADHNIKFTGTVFRKGVRLPGQGEDQDGEEQVRRDDP